MGEPVQDFSKFREGLLQREHARAIAAATGKSISEQQHEKSKEHFQNALASKLTDIAYIHNNPGMSIQETGKTLGLTQHELDQYNQGRTIKEQAKRNKSKFVNNLKENLVAEAINVVFSAVGEEAGFSDRHYQLGRNIIDNFVHNEGAGELLRRMTETSTLLSSYACIIAESQDNIIKEIVESAKKNGKSFEDDDICYTMDAEFAKKYVDTIAMATPKQIVKIVSDRVEKAVADFVNQTADRKAEVQTILSDTKAKLEKIPEAKRKEYSEAYTEQANRKIAKIYAESVNLYGALCNKFSKDIMREKGAFVENGYITEDNHLNMGMIMNDTRVTYTVLETINTLGLGKITSDSIKEMMEQK